MPVNQRFYAEKVSRYTGLIASNKRKRALIAFSRLATFLSMILFVYFYLKTGLVAYLLVSIVLLLFFILLVRVATDLTNTMKLLIAYRLVNQNELDTHSGKPNYFNDGNEYASPNGYGQDLDVFGPGSLFHLINRTTTLHGRNKLSTMLNQPVSDASTIAEWQEGIKTISKYPEVCQSVIVKGLLFENAGAGLDTVITWISGAPCLRNRAWIRYMRWTWPAITVGTFLYYLDTGNYLFFVFSVFVSWIITGSFSSYIKAQHELIAQKQEILSQYAGVLKAFEKTPAEESTLIDRLKVITVQAGSAIHRLSRLTSMFDQRANMVVNFFLNSFLLYDIQCALSLEKWKSAHKNEFSQWIEAAGTIEALASFGVFAFNHPHYRYAQTLTGPARITAESIGHPLIDEAELVRNDLLPGPAEKFLLITGSNMSGKTTFLRAVGINLLLAQCGAPVCAGSFAFTPMGILSSIRINDSLQSHTSYFMAELKRLKGIIEELEKGLPCLILIDEILKGTNTDDKTFGSEGFIRKVLSFNSFSLFATHDLNLSRLETQFPMILKNHCFESRIDDGELIFDYRLQEGVAKNKNASYLMKKLGIIA